MVTKPSADKRCYVVALTGGIASGKTAVSDRFAQLGAAVIDADVIARTVVEPGSTGLSRVVRAFGAEILNSDETLNRRQLRQIIFADEKKRQQLEHILHPLIGQRALDELAAVTDLYAILVVPLLVQSELRHQAQRILVVDVEPEIQIQRLTRRDGSSYAQAQAILQAQASREDRLAIADDVIGNDGSLTELYGKVGVLHEKYKLLATAYLHLQD